MMTMNFDVNASNLGKATNSFAPLAPNKIHDVLFKGVEYSQSKDGKYEFMRIKFTAKDGSGSYTDTTFGLDNKSGERKKTQYGENPSHYENLMMKVKHLLSAVAPDILEKMQNKEIVFAPKTKANIFKQYVEFIASLVATSVDVETQIKLVKTVRAGKEESSFPPFFASVSKNNEVYMKTNFIGSNLAFTVKEKEAIDKEGAARPSVMPNLSSTDLSLDDSIDSTDDIEVAAEAQTESSGSDLLNINF